MIVIPPGTSALCEKIVRTAQLMIPIEENPPGSNRSPEIDAMCERFGVPLASYWCALLASSVWQDSGAEIPPTKGDSHPAKAESWRVWAFRTNRFSHIPKLGYAVLYGVDGNKPAEHIGCCVVSVTPLLMDIEGNTSLAGFSRNGIIADMKPVNTGRLIGYVSPEPLLAVGA